MSNRELLSLHIGQAGTQVGASFWELLAREHNLDFDGNVGGDFDFSAPSPGHAMFYESSIGTYHPRALFLDTEPDPIEHIFESSTSFLGSLIPSSQLLYEQEGSNDIYSRGHYTIGKVLVDRALDAIRHQAEKCDSFDGFLCTMSLCGGTGSGFSTLLLERLTVMYGRKSIVCAPLQLSDKYVTNTVAAYSAVSSIHRLTEHAALEIWFDNAALSKACELELNNPNLSYVHLNQRIAQVLSDITAPCRFPTSTDTAQSLSHLIASLVPYPRIHHVFASSVLPQTYANKQKQQNPPNNQNQNQNNEKTAEDLLRLSKMAVTDRDCRLLNINSGPTISSAWLYRGDVQATEAGQVAQTARDEGWQQRTGLSSHSLVKISTNASPALTLNTPPVDHLDEKINSYYTDFVRPAPWSTHSRRVSTLTCSTSMAPYLKVILDKYSTMYAKRAFVHWIVGEGCESGEMSEQYEDSYALMRDYEEVAENAPEADSQQDQCFSLA